MAVLFPPRLYARDASGNGYSGALLYVYTINTTTPASVYTTSALSTPHASPIVADSNGLFAVIYAADGTTFDTVLKTSGGVTIWTADDQPALGEAPASLLRDFGSGGRFEVSGSGGAITMKAMDASGDDTGGDLTIQGGGSTALDTLYANATAFSVRPSALRDTGGTDLTLAANLLVMGGKKLPHIAWTSATFSAASTVDITLPTGYDVFDVDLADLVVSSAQEIRCRLSYDNGSNYKSGASDYTSQSVVNGTLVATGTTTFFTLHTLGTSTAMKSEVRLRLNTTSTASVATTISGTARAQTVSMSMFAGETATQYGRATNIRFYMAAGTMTGRYRLIAHRGLAGTDA